MAIPLLLFIINVGHVLSVKSPDNEVVCLYEEWMSPVEKIESKQRLFELVPNDGRGGESKTENNILLHLYTDECIEGLSHPFFAGAHYQTGPAVLHLASFNYKAFYPQLFSAWNLPTNCSLFIFIPIDKTFADSRDFNVLQVADLRSFTAFIHENRKTQCHFTNDFGKDVKFYWYEKNPKYLDIINPNQVRTEHTFLGHIFKATDAADDSFIDLYVVDGTEHKSISSMSCSWYLRTSKKK